MGMIYKPFLLLYFSSYNLACPLWIVPTSSIHTQGSHCSHPEPFRESARMEPLMLKPEDAVSLQPFCLLMHGTQGPDAGQSEAPRLASFSLGTHSHRNTHLDRLPTLPAWSQDVGSLQPSANRSPCSRLSSGELTELVNLSLFSVEQHTGHAHSHIDAG